MISRIVLVLALAICACGASRTKPAAPAPVKALDPMSLLVEGSDLLAVLDVKALLRSPLMVGVDLRAEFAEDEDVRFLLDAGLEPTSVDKVILSGNFSKRVASFVVVGAFDAAKVVAAINQNFAASGEPDTAEALAPNLFVVVGKPEDLPLIKSARGLDGSPELVALMPFADVRKELYAIHKFSPEFLNELRASSPMPNLFNIDSVSLALSIADGIELRGLFQMYSSDDASFVANMAQIFLPILSSAGVPDELIDAIQVSHDGSVVSVSLALSEGQARQLKDLSPQGTSPEFPF